MSTTDSQPRLRSDIVPVPAAGPCLLLHGGAWDIPDAFVSEHRTAMREAIGIGERALTSGAPAVDVVTDVVAAMEASGVFDAGCGAVLTRKGTVELDAGVMDGETLSFGAVAAVRRLGTPIRVARRLLDHGAGMVRILVGEEAERFAAVEGIRPVHPDSLIHARERIRFAHLRAEEGFHTSEAFLPGGARMPSGTVGCVARDREGGLAAATSTGGTPYRPPGRVGDTPLPGCGFYADADAAVSSTGWGEAIAAANLSGRVAKGVEDGGDPEEVAAGELRRMHGRIRNAKGEGAAGGCIVLTASGRAAWCFTTPRMARGGWSDGGEAWVDV